MTGLAVAGALLLGGCRPAGTGDADAPKPAVKTARADGVVLTVTAGRTTASVGDSIELELLLQGADPGDVTWPALEDKLDSFYVRRLPEVVPKEPKAEGRPLLRQAYLLRPLEPGSLSIPGIEVRVGAGPAATQPAEAVVLKTEPIVIDVSAVAPQDASPTSRPAATDEPLALARPRGFGWVAWPAGVLAAVCVLLLAIWWLRRRRGLPRPEPVVPPDVWALEQLRRLRERDLVGRGRVQEFYFELNMIVRQYIERRFGLRAPEMTTEEFLLSLRAAPSAGLDQRSRDALLPFLEACDLVKYARYEPAPPEIRAVDRAAEQFVVDTASDTGPVAPATELEEILEEARP